MFKALEFNPNYVDTYNNLGTMYFEMGDYKKAYTTYQKGLQLAPQSPVLLKNLELAKQKMYTN